MFALVWLKSAVNAGPELMAHEVTVPSITTVLLSAACFAVAEATRLAAKCSEAIAAAIDGAYMVSLATVVVWVRCRCLLSACLVSSSHWRRVVLQCLISGA